MINHRPVLAIPKTRLEVFLNVLSFMMLLGNLVYLFIAWTSLPDRIPIHFNGHGEVDGWGGKGSIWVLEGIAIVLWIGFTFLEKYPHVYNYIFLTQENVERQYKNARQMLNMLKTVLTFTLTILSVKIVQAVNGTNTSIGIWIFPMIITPHFWGLRILYFSVLSIEIIRTVEKKELFMEMVFFYVLGVFPILVILASIMSFKVIQKWYVMPLVTLVFFSAFTFAFLSKTFFLWVLMYVVISIIVGLIMKNKNKKKLV